MEGDLYYSQSFELSEYLLVLTYSGNRLKGHP